MAKGRDSESRGKDGREEKEENSRKSAYVYA